jgi:hypothetical protein
MWGYLETKLQAKTVDIGVGLWRPIQQTSGEIKNTPGKFESF